MPPKKLLGSGFSTPYTHFFLMCIISSELTCVSHFYPFEWAGVDIRWFSVDGFDTRWIPRSFSCGMYVYTCKNNCMYMYVYIGVCVFICVCVYVGCMHINTCVQYKYMCTYVYAYIYVYVYMFRCIHIKYMCTILINVHRYVCIYVHMYMLGASI